MRLIRLAVLSGLSYVVWKNRFRLQQFAESRGVSTPLLKGSFGETLRSGFARIAGQARHENQQIKESA